MKPITDAEFHRPRTKPIQPVAKTDLPRPGKKPTTKAKVSEHTRTEFKEQVLRLAACDFFPSLDEGVKELLETLMRVSADLDHGRRIIDHALQYAKCPTPADLIELAGDVKTTEVPKGCEKCEGTGRVYITRKTQDPITKEWYEADCQATCGCALGRFLLTKDQERRKSA